MLFLSLAICTFLSTSPIDVLLDLDLGMPFALTLWQTTVYFNAHCVHCYNINIQLICGCFIYINYIVMPIPFTLWIVGRFPLASYIIMNWYISSFNAIFSDYIAAMVFTIMMRKDILIHFQGFWWSFQPFPVRYIASVFSSEIHCLSLSLWATLPQACPVRYISSGLPYEIY